MDETQYIFDNLNKTRQDNLSLNLSALLKLPIFVILFGNILYALILLLRVRILADTFESNAGGKIKILMYGYLTLIVVGSLISLLFIVLG